MTGSQTSTLAIFDLCDTLYAENTTRGFVRFFQQRHGGRWGRTVVASLYSRRFPVFYLLAVLYRAGSIDLYRWTLARSLKGYERALLAAAARAYVAEVLPPIENSGIHRLLARHRDAGDRVVIVSNSLDVVVEAVAEKLGVEGRGSRLGYVQGRCSGRIELDLTGRKSGVVAELARNHPAPAEVHAYTDNLTDRDLVQAADHPTIIVPAGRTRARWGDIDAVFIEL